MFGVVRSHTSQRNEPKHSYISHVPHLPTSVMRILFHRVDNNKNDNNAFCLKAPFKTVKDTPHNNKTVRWIIIVNLLHTHTHTIRILILLRTNKTAKIILKEQKTFSFGFYVFDYHFVHWVYSQCAFNSMIILQKIYAQPSPLSRKFPLSPRLIAHFFTPLWSRSVFSSVLSVFFIYLFLPLKADWWIFNSNWHHFLWQSGHILYQLLLRIACSVQYKRL